MEYVQLTALGVKVSRPIRSSRNEVASENEAGVWRVGSLGNFWSASGTCHSKHTTNQAISHHSQCFISSHLPHLCYFVCARRCILDFRPRSVRKWKTQPAQLLHDTTIWEGGSLHPIAAQRRLSVAEADLTYQITARANSAETPEHPRLDHWPSSVSLASCCLSARLKPMPSFPPTFFAGCLGSLCQG